jgi:hypothetical protein
MLAQERCIVEQRPIVPWYFAYHISNCPESLHVVELITEETHVFLHPGYEGIVDVDLRCVALSKSPLERKARSTKRIVPHNENRGQLRAWARMR